MKLNNEDKQTIVGKAYLRAACGMLAASHIPPMEACKIVMSILANSYGNSFKIIAMRGRNLTQTLN